jgi:hypothetical protein
LGRKQSADARVGAGDYGGRTPGSQTGQGLVAVGLPRQSDGRSVASRATTHVNQGDPNGPDVDRRPSFG